MALTCMVALAGLILAAFALRTWNESGELTAFSYAVATTYIVFPTAITYRYLNKLIIRE